MPGVQVWTVTQPEAGQKLLQFLHRRLSGAVPRSALQRWIRTGQVRVEGARAKPGTRLEMEQLVRVPPHDLGEPVALIRDVSTAPPEDGLAIIHEDTDLLVLAKPKGLPVHSGTGHQDSITARLHKRFASHPWKPTPVHRLDRDTTGLLIIAKTYARLQALHALWRSGLVTKTYLAWVQGTPSWNQPTLLEDAVVKTASETGERMQVGAGKTCRTRIRTLFRTRKSALVLVAPLTGRTHQIRVQLAARGHPLIGDVKYDGPTAPCGMLLHAWHIAWPGRSFHLSPNWPAPWKLPRCLTVEALDDATRDLSGHPPDGGHTQPLKAN